MAVWGSGTLEDPWKVTDWDNFVSRCNETQSADRTYIEFPTHDQNGNLIPVEERVIDLRHHEWFVGNNGYSAIIGIQRFKTIEGNGWTILGMSIRNMSLFNIMTDSSGTGDRNRNRNFEMKNLNFQNIYVHGMCTLFVPSANGSRFSISSCKFSGVFDASIIDIYNSSWYNSNAITRGTMYSGYNVFTACSFNFKFVSGMRIEYTETAGSWYCSSEFNNCIFNIEGKPKPYSDNLIGSSGYDSGRFYLMYGGFYFCKFTGKLLLDCADSWTQEKYLGTYFNTAGSLNVIDITLKKVTTQQTYFKYVYHICYTSYNSNEVTIRYFDTTNFGSTVGLTFNTHNSNLFKIPADRAQMVDEDWLEDQGFVIGTAPTT